MREPITTESRISYVNSDGDLVVFDVPMTCANCSKCLGNSRGRCVCGGPFDVNLNVYRAAPMR